MEDLQSAVEHIDDVTKRATVKIAAATFATEYGKAVVDLSKKANIKGFRAGKAPQQMIEKLHGERLRWEVTNRLVSESLEKVIKDLGGDVVGQPEVDLGSVEPGKDIEFSAKIYLFPKPEIQGYQGVKVSVPKRQVTDADVEQGLQELRQSKATHKKIEGRTKAAADDVVDTSLQLIIPGQEPTPAEPLVIGLGEKRLLPELEAGIVGMEIGQTKEIPTVIPADHANADLRGKEVKYVVTLNSISEKVLPEADDEFAKSLGFKEMQTLLEVKLDIRKRMEQGAEKEASELVREAVLEQLAASNSFTVPEVLVDDEIRNLVVRKGLVDPKTVKESSFPVDEWRADFREAALKRVRISIIVDQIALKEKLNSTSEDIDGYLTGISNSLEVPLETTKKFFLSRDRALSTFLEVTRNKVLEFLEKNAVVEYTAAAGSKA